MHANAHQLHDTTPINAHSQFIFRVNRFVKFVCEKQFLKSVFKKRFQMGILISRYSGMFDPDPFENRANAGEDQWLQIENVPIDNSSRKARNKKCSKKNAGKYAGKRERNISGCLSFS